MSYNNELVDSMRPLCNELQDNNELYRLVIMGDKVAKDAMIINNYRLVLSIVENYIAGLPQFEHLRDDLVGEGLLGLTEAVNQMKECKIDPVSYMSRIIRNHIVNYIRKDKSDDIPFEEPSESNESDDDNSNDELEEDILACCSEDEKPVIELWIAGNSERNIANTLGINDTYVHRIIEAVKIRIIAKFGTDKRVIIE